MRRARCWQSGCAGGVNCSSPMHTCILMSNCPCCLGGGRGQGLNEMEAVPQTRIP